MIPLTKPYITEQDIADMCDVVRSGDLTTGEQVMYFEQAVADYTGRKHAVSFNSCASALEAVLQVLQVGPGDEVICPSYSFVATANAIFSRGATPVFVDIDLETFNINPQKIIEKINKNTKAIMPVSQIGMPISADFSNIWSVPVFEDAACSIGSKITCRTACLSFHPRKVVTTGEGGMVVTDNGALAEELREIASHHPVTGHNYRMPDILAVLGLGQMERLDEQINHRQKLAHMYNKILGDRVKTPFLFRDWNVQSYQVLLQGQNRDMVVARLRERGVMATRGVGAIHLIPQIREKVGQYSLPNTEYAAANSIIMPLYHEMTEEDVTFCANALLGVLNNE